MTDKKICELSARVLNEDEETCNSQINNYVTDRIKAMQIDNIEDIVDN